MEKEELVGEVEVEVGVVAVVGGSGETTCTRLSLRSRETERLCLGVFTIACGPISGELILLSSPASVAAASSSVSSRERGGRLLLSPLELEMGDEEVELSSRWM